MAGKKIEEAWAATSSIVLGEPLDSIDRYGKWLFSYMPGWREVETKSGAAYVKSFSYSDNTPYSIISS